MDKPDASISRDGIHLNLAVSWVCDRWDLDSKLLSLKRSRALAAHLPTDLEELNELALPYN